MLGGFAFVMACATSNPNSLKGSISETYDLSFTQVRAVLELDQSMSLYYETPQTNVSEAPYALWLRFDFGGLPPLPQEELTQSVIADIGRYQQTRNSQGQIVEDRAPFPTLQRANLRFSEYGSNFGDSIAGSFEIIFTNGDTLIGDFTATLSNPI